MCLNRLNRIFEGQGRTIYHGWKIFDTLSLRDSNALGFQFFDLNDSPTVRRGVWLKADTRLWLRARSYHWNGKYRSGFHIYREQPTHELASGEKLVQVKYRRLLAKGSAGFDSQGRLLFTDVAAEMWVPKQQRKNRGDIRARAMSANFRKIYGKRKVK